MPAERFERLVARDASPPRGWLRAARRARGRPLPGSTSTSSAGPPRPHARDARGETGAQRPTPSARSDGRTTAPSCSRSSTTKKRSSRRSRSPAARRRAADEAPRRRACATSGSASRAGPREATRANPAGLTARQLEVLVADRRGPDERGDRRPARRVAANRRASCGRRADEARRDVPPRGRSARSRAPARDLRLNHARGGPRGRKPPSVSGLLAVEHQRRTASASVYVAGIAIASLPQPVI